MAKCAEQPCSCASMRITVLMHAACTQRRSRKQGSSTHRRDAQRWQVGKPSRHARPRRRRRRPASPRPPRAPRPTHRLRRPDRRRRRARRRSQPQAPCLPCPVDRGARGPRLRRGHGAPAEQRLRRLPRAGVPKAHLLARGGVPCAPCRLHETRSVCDPHAVRPSAVTVRRPHLWRLFPSPPASSPTLRPPCPPARQPAPCLRAARARARPSCHAGSNVAVCASLLHARFVLLAAHAQVLRHSCKETDAVHARTAGNSHHEPGGGAGHVRQARGAATAAPRGEKTTTRSPAKRRSTRRVRRRARGSCGGELEARRGRVGESLLCAIQEGRCMLAGEVVVAPTRWPLRGRCQHLAPPPVVVHGRRQAWQCARAGWACPRAVVTSCAQAGPPSRRASSSRARRRAHAHADPRPRVSRRRRARQRGQEPRGQEPRGQVPLRQSVMGLILPDDPARDLVGIIGAHVLPNGTRRTFLMSRPRSQRPHA